MYREKDTKVALIAIDDYDRNFYCNLLSDYKDIDLELYFTIHQFRMNCAEKEYSGFIIDMHTLINSSMKDKEFFSALNKRFPTIQVRRDGIDDIKCIMDQEESKELKGKQLFNQFAKTYCVEFNPRKIRLSPRKKIYFNGNLYLSENAKPIKTNLLNISEGGCFVLLTEVMNKGDHVILTLNELNDKTKIDCETRWVKPWGIGINHLAGFGASFKNIKDNQLMEIKEYIQDH